MDRDLSSRISPWINWSLILILGPLFAFFLADLCGFRSDSSTFQVILLVEICLLAGGVIVLLLVQAFGPWTDCEYEAREWLRVLTPPPGSLLEEVKTQPARWDREIDRHLRGSWREIRDGVVPVAARPESSYFEGASPIEPPVERTRPAPPMDRQASMGPQRRRPPGRPQS
ncbi:MAG: hypothetical protein KDA75_16960 [Planctomycetaceae bacterium]|nr:hypothetical protein [Planctomycetaceae bacterium]